MNRFTTSIFSGANGKYRLLSDKKSNVGNFNLRNAVSKFVDSIITTRTGKIADKTRARPKRLGSRSVKAIKKSIRRPAVLRQIRTAVNRRLRQKSFTTASYKTQVPAVQLVTHAQLNADGDRIPDAQSLDQVEAFTTASDDIQFVLSKVKYHKTVEAALDERSKLLLQLQKTPDSLELRKKKNDLEKIVGNCHHELNKAFISGFIARSMQLLNNHSMDEVTKNNLIKLLEGKDEFANLSATEFDQAMTQFQKQIANDRAAKKTFTAAAA